MEANGWSFNYRRTIPLKAYLSTKMCPCNDNLCKVWCFLVFSTPLAPLRAPIWPAAAPLTGRPQGRAQGFIWCVFVWSQKSKAPCFFALVFLLFYLLFFFCIIPLSLVARSDFNEVVVSTLAFRHHRVSTGSGSGLSRCPETYASSAQVMSVRTAGVSECMSQAV